jgi:hypothetical protein
VGWGDDVRLPPPLTRARTSRPGQTARGFRGGGIVERRAWAIAAHAREGREKEGLHRARRLHHSEENPQTIVQRARAGGLAGGQGLPGDADPPRRLASPRGRGRGVAALGRDNAAPRAVWHAVPKARGGA